jgi:hypothetical protein
MPRGKKRAIVAVSRPILVIGWAPALRPRRPLHRPGSDFYDKRSDPERRKRNHTPQLEALGYKVTLKAAA